MGFTIASEIGFVNLTLGLFAIFFPHDGHMPQAQYADKPEAVKKIVIKVPAATVVSGKRQPGSAKGKIVMTPQEPV